MMNWWKGLSKQQQQSVVLTIVIFGARYVVLNIVASLHWVFLPLYMVLFPDIELVCGNLESKGWSDTSIALCVYLTLLITSYLCALLLVALHANRSQGDPER